MPLTPTVTAPLAVGVTAAVYTLLLVVDWVRPEIVPLVTTMSVSSKPVTTSEKVKVTKPLAPTDISVWAGVSATVGAVVSEATATTAALTAAAVKLRFKVTAAVFTAAATLPPSAMTLATALEVVAMLSDRLLRPTLAVLATSSETSLILARFPPDSAEAVAATDFAVEMTATFAVDVALELIKVANDVMVASPSTLPRDAATVFVSTVFIAAATTAESLEVKAAASAVDKAAMYLNAFIAMLAVVPVAPKPSDKLVADLTAIMMFCARVWNLMAAAAVLAVVAPASAATGS